MRVLVIKTTSMGDVIHTLPALTDAARAIPAIKFDWVVEEGFDEIPGWHPAVDQVIPVAIRRWRKTLLTSLKSPEWKQCKQLLRQRHYDCVIDAQGLLKSAWLARYVNAPRFGFDRQSVREPLATLAYHHKINVSKQMHAVERTRQLFAKSLGYELPIPAAAEMTGGSSYMTGDYGIDKARFRSSGGSHPCVVFLHGTTRDNKHWPESYWCQLCKSVTDAGFSVCMPWGNAAEKARAERIAAVSPAAKVLPKLNLHGLAAELSRSVAAVAVDTGLGHLSAALDVPAISLYGPTSPGLIGAYGGGQIYLQAGEQPAVSGVEPAEMAALTPALVMASLQPILDASSAEARC